MCTWRLCYYSFMISMWRPVLDLLIKSVILTLNFTLYLSKLTVDLKIKSMGFWDRNLIYSSDWLKTQDSPLSFWWYHIWQVWILTEVSFCLLLFRIVPYSFHFESYPFLAPADNHLQRENEFSPVESYCLCKPHLKESPMLTACQHRTNSVVILKVSFVL